MAVEILLPMIGSVISDGQITAWLAGEGDTVVKGQPLFSLRTDAATEDVVAQSTGTLRIISRTDHAYEVGDVLGYIE